MSIHPGLSDRSDYLREILDVASRAEAEAASLAGGLGLCGELNEIRDLARAALELEQ